MPIVVDYSPVGLLTSLASSAGLGQASKQADQLALQQGAQAISAGHLALSRQQADREEAARQQAFRLQEAAAERAMRRDTPMAAHTLTASEQARNDRLEAQQSTKTQLDAMMKAGQISPDNYQRAWLGVLSGNDTLVAHAMAQEKPSITNPEELRLITSRYASQRRILERRLAAATKAQQDYAYDEEQTAKYETQAGELEKQIEAVYAAEEAEVTALRSGRRSGESPKPEGTAQIIRHQPELNVGVLPPGEVLDSETLEPGGVMEPVGRPLTPAIVQYAKRQFGTDREAAKNWLREQGYEVD